MGDAPQLVGGPAHFGVGAIRFQVVGQNALPIGLLAIVDGVPVPVLHHVRAAAKMRVHIQPELAIVGRKLAFRIPSDGLRIGLSDQVIRLLQRPRIVAREARPHAIEVILRAVIGIDRDDVECASDVIFVHLFPWQAGKILSDELARTLVLVDGGACQARKSMVCHRE